MVAAVEGDADVNATGVGDSRERTPLHWAV